MGLHSASATTNAITFVGHATTLLRLDGASVLTDPILRRHVGPLRRKGPPVDRGEVGAPDLVVLSHLHRDHLDLPSLRLLPPATPVVLPAGGGRFARRTGLSELIELRPGETATVAGVEVRATEAVHDGHRERYWGPEVEPLGFVVARAGRRAYFAGDTDLFDGMAELGPLDLALLPVAGWGPTLGRGHLDPERAARALRLLKPRVAVPIHWGTFYPFGMRRRIGDGLTEPPLEFARLATEHAPEVEVRVLEPGASSELPDGVIAKMGRAVGSR